MKTMRYAHILGLSAIAAALFAAGACRTQDIRIQVIRTPQLFNNDCAQIIVRDLSKAEGVRDVAYSLQDKTVTVTYDSLKLALKNLESVIAAAGFDANDTPANPQARAALPEVCRQAPAP